MDSFNKLPFGSQRFSGYTSDPTNASPDYLSYPSQNCMVTEDGKAESRLGYRSEFSIGVTGFSATAYYHKKYDIAFFALGTKVYYRDFTTNVTYDTGITLTSGTVTRFEEIFGDIKLSNTTDGVYMIRCMRLNDAAPNAGDSTVTIDVDGAARISVFGDIAAGGSGDDLRIRGTNEQMTSLVISTGVVTLTGTLSQSYSDNDIAIVVRQYASLEKFSKSLLWKNRLHGMGFPSATNADQPNNTVMAGQFVIGQTGASGIELIIDFTYGTGGSTKIVIAGGGKVTNILGAKDYIWFFTEGKVFATASADISTDASGGSIGLTIPIEKDSLHGCLNEDCATVMGDSAITYITPDRRIMRIPIATDTGAPVSPAEEDFDVDIKGELKNMDRDQEGAFAYHYRGGRQTIYQVKENGFWVWHIFDQNIIRSQGSNFVRGAWQPPQFIAPMKNLFERDGVLYGTDASTDVVYSIFTTYTDNNIAIYSIIATGEFNVGNAMMSKAELQGDINFPSEINLRCFVTNDKGGKRAGSTKMINGSDYGYGNNDSIGAIPVGESASVGPNSGLAQWRKSFDIYPSEANRVQLIAENFQDGGYFSISSFYLSGDQYSSTFSASL